MSFDVNRVCRVCLEEGVPNALTSLFSGDFGMTPCAMLMLCAKVQIRSADGMPTHICNNCIYRLGVAYHFKQQCENSDFRLRQFLGLEFKFSNKDASTNTEQPIIMKQEPEKKKPVPRRIRKSSSNRRKPEEAKLKRGPKPKPKQPQTCFECGKSFKCAAQLEMHIRTHTGERPFICGFCPKRFAQKHNLSVHLRTHTGEKPFQCEICSKQFSALGNFQSHKKIHSGIRDQVCPICNKAFISSGDLSKHMIIHTGIKNHHCEICGKGFYRSRDMVSHKNKVHNIERVPLVEAQPSTISTNDPTTEQENQIIRRPVMPFLLAAPAARRPTQGYRDETFNAHPPVLITHVQMEY